MKMGETESSATLAECDDPAPRIVPSAMPLRSVYVMDPCGGASLATSIPERSRAIAAPSAQIANASTKCFIAGCWKMAYVRAFYSLLVAVAIAAASLLYVAMADLIPGLHRRADAAASLAQVLLISLGIALIAWIGRD